MKFFFVFACGGLLVVDRLLKHLALIGISREFGPVRFELFKNDALVFSWPAPNWLAVILMVLALGVVVVLFIRGRRQHNFPAVIGSSIILWGAISNLYDRLAYGYVVDWAFFGRWWPVFNLADVFIAIGVVLIVFGKPRLTKASV